MPKINTDSWGKFRVGDLFEIHPTSAYKMINAQLLDNGDNPVVANSAYNNGIGGYSTQPPTEHGNMITFSDTVDANTIFYQPNSFVGYPHIQGLYPIGIYANDWNELRYLFFVSVFRKTALTKGFNYGNKFRRDIAVDLIIKLPITSAGSPDWDYMEFYVRKIIKESAANLESLKQTDKSKKVINSMNWKEFRIGDLFDTFLSKDDIQLKSIIKGEIPLVSSGKNNNGIVEYIADDKAKIWDANTITVDMFGKAFYQNNSYHCVSHGRVNILVSKFNLTECIGLFLCSAIEQVSVKYQFDNMCTGEKLSNDIIKLPATSNGQPDWDCMDSYMRKVLNNVATRVGLLTSIIKE